VDFGELTGEIEVLGLEDVALSRQLVTPNGGEK